MLEHSTPVSVHHLTKLVNHAKSGPSLIKLEALPVRGVWQEVSPQYSWLTLGQLYVQSALQALTQLPRARSLSPLALIAVQGRTILCRVVQAVIAVLLGLFIRG